MTNLDPVHRTKEQIRHDEQVRRLVAKLTKLRARIPAVCPRCHGDGWECDNDKLYDGVEGPISRCPTCAPFGGRGAIWLDGGDHDD